MGLQPCGHWHPGVLRIDPLFPRLPLLTQPSSLWDIGMKEAQPLGDLEHIVAFGGDAGVRHVVFTATKIVQPRGRPVRPTMAAMHAGGRSGGTSIGGCPRRSPTGTSFSRFVKSVGGEESPGSSA